MTACRFCLLILLVLCVLRAVSKGQMVGYVTGVGQGNLYYDYYHYDYQTTTVAYLEALDRFSTTDVPVGFEPVTISQGVDISSSVPGPSYWYDSQYQTTTEPQLGVFDRVNTTDVPEEFEPVTNSQGEIINSPIPGQEMYNDARSAGGAPTMATISFTTRRDPGVVTYQYSRSKEPKINDIIQSTISNKQVQKRNDKLSHLQSNDLPSKSSSVKNTATIILPNRSKVLWSIGNIYQDPISQTLEVNWSSVENSLAYVYDYPKTKTNVTTEPNMNHVIHVSLEIPNEKNNVNSFATIDSNTALDVIPKTEITPPQTTGFETTTIAYVSTTQPLKSQGWRDIKMIRMKTKYPNKEKMGETSRSGRMDGNNSWVSETKTNFSTGKSHIQVIRKLPTRNKGAQDQRESNLTQPAKRPNPKSTTTRSKIKPTIASPKPKPNTTKPKPKSTTTTTEPPEPEEILTTSRPYWDYYGTKMQAAFGYSALSLQVLLTEQRDNLLRDKPTICFYCGKYRIRVQWILSEQGIEHSF